MLLIIGKTYVVGRDHLFDEVRAKKRNVLKLLVNTCAELDDLNSHAPARYPSGHAECRRHRRSGQVRRRHHNRLIGVLCSKKVSAFDVLNFFM